MFSSKHDLLIQGIPQPFLLPLCLCNLPSFSCAMSVACQVVSNRIRQLLLKKGSFLTQDFFSAVYSSMTKFITQPTNIVLPTEGEQQYGRRGRREVKTCFSCCCHLENSMCTYSLMQRIEILAEVVFRDKVHFFLWMAEVSVLSLSLSPL